VSYEFLFMRASGDQLRQITALVDQGVLRPLVGKVFDFAQTPQAMQSIAKGGIRGKGGVTSSADSPSTIHLIPRSEGRTTS
jgi:NADPH:quinone reductase-like Zn-dependent oxidoreductase